MCYAPPTNNTKILKKLQSIEKVGNRWFPTMANIFTLIATKNTTSNSFIHQDNLYNPNLKPTLETVNICKIK